MGWTSPRTWTTGEITTAAQMNEQVRDNELYLKSQNNIGCLVAMGGNTEIDNTTETVLVWDNEQWDTDSMHSDISSPSKITIVTAGLYIVGVNIFWEPEASAVGYRYATLLKGGNPALFQSKTYAVIVNAYEIINHFVAYLDLNAEDYLQVEVYHNQGGGTDVTSAQSRFWVQRIADAIP